MPLMPWTDCDDDQKRATLDWIVDTCLMWGSERRTAFQVASSFAAGLDDELYPRRGTDT